MRTRRVLLRARGRRRHGSCRHRARAGIAARRQRPPPAAINGSGSTYVALAMQQWMAEARPRASRSTTPRRGRRRGWPRSADRSIDFAGTEAEFSSLGIGSDEAVARLPVRARRRRRGGHHVQRRRTRPGARSTTCTCHARPWPRSSWATSPTGPTRPDHARPRRPAPVCPTSRSPSSTGPASRARPRCSTTSCRTPSPALFAPWAARNSLPTNVRIIQLDSRRTSHPSTNGLNGSSDQIAQFVASARAVVDRLRRVRLRQGVRQRRRRGSRTPPGNWVMPYAANISAALESATLRPDLSQEPARRLRQPEPGRLPDLGVQLHRHAVRGRWRPADVQGQLPQRRRVRDARRLGCATSRARARSRWPTSATRRSRPSSRSSSPTPSGACGAAAPRR